MVPRIIHQIWIGPRSLPDQYRAWRKRLVELHPGWDVRLWSESSLPDYERVVSHFDLRGYPPATITEIFRYMLVLQHGGIYLDCDCEPVASLEPLRGHRFVGSGESLAGLDIVTIAGFGAEAGSPVLSSFLDRCEAMRTAPVDVHHRFGEHAFSSHLSERRKELALLPKAELERYFIHHWHGSWHTPEALKTYRPVYQPTRLEEPFKSPPAQPAPLSQSGARRPWPTAEQMLGSNRGPNVGCCSRPSNAELRKR